MYYEFNLLFLQVLRGLKKKKKAYAGKIWPTPFTHTHSQVLLLPAVDSNNTNNKL